MAVAMYSAGACNGTRSLVGHALGTALHMTLPASNASVTMLPPSTGTDQPAVLFCWWRGKRTGMLTSWNGSNPTCNLEFRNQWVQA